MAPEPNGEVPGGAGAESALLIALINADQRPVSRADFTDEAGLLRRLLIAAPAGPPRPTHSDYLAWLLERRGPLEGNWLLRRIMWIVAPAVLWNPNGVVGWDINTKKRLINSSGPPSVGIGTWSIDDEVGAVRRRECAKIAAEIQPSISSHWPESNDLGVPDDTMCLWREANFPPDGDLVTWGEGLVNFFSELANTLAAPLSEFAAKST
jgi:hypothetical protein